MRDAALAPRRPSTKAAARLAACLPAGIVRHEVTDRAAWLQHRRQDVTASAIAAVPRPTPARASLGPMISISGIPNAVPIVAS